MVFSVELPDNRRNLVDFALSVSLLQNEGFVPEKEPKRADIKESTDTFARGVIINADISVKVAFEVVLNLRSNLKPRIPYADGVCRLLSAQDIVAICKHAMEQLKSAFKPYSERLREFSILELTALARGVAGTPHRATRVNLLTGEGLQFSGITLLYYNCTKLYKKEALKRLFLSGDRILFYIPTFPEYPEIAEVVSKIMVATSAVKAPQRGFGNLRENLI